MAYQIEGVSITRRSSGDMSDNQFKLVEFSTTNDDQGCVVASAGGKVHGVFLGNSTAEQPGKVQITGVAPVAAGSTTTAAITQGAPLVSDANGRAVPSTASGQYRAGFALESLSSETEAVIAVQLAQGITT